MQAKIGDVWLFSALVFSILYFCAFLLFLCDLFCLIFDICFALSYVLFSQSRLALVTQYKENQQDSQGRILGRILAVCTCGLGMLVP